MINRMARAALGAFRSTPLGILAAEWHRPSETLARPPSDQVCILATWRAQGSGGEGPEGILGREGAPLVARLRAAASLRPGVAVEAQEWGNRRLFPGQAIVEGREDALQTASSWQQEC